MLGADSRPGINWGGQQMLVLCQMGGCLWLRSTACGAVVNRGPHLHSRVESVCVEHAGSEPPMFFLDAQTPLRRVVRYTWALLSCSVQTRRVWMLSSTCDCLSCSSSFSSRTVRWWPWQPPTLLASWLSVRPPSYWRLCSGCGGIGPSFCPRCVLWCVIPFPKYSFNG